MGVGDYDIYTYYLLLIFIIFIMSILIKSDELNYLIYKYLQEAGLNHTAFSFYNEAALESVITEFKYNT